MEWARTCDEQPKQQVPEHVLPHHSAAETCDECWSLCCPSLQTLFEDLPESTVSFDHRLAGLQLPDSPSGGPVKLTFDVNSNHNSAAGSGEKGNSTTSSTYSARIVLGCDGLLSPTRRLWMPDAEAPTFKGNVALRGRIPTQALRRLQAWSSSSGSGSTNGAVLSRSYASPAGKQACGRACLRAIPGIALCPSEQARWLFPCFNLSD